MEFYLGRNNEDFFRRVDDFETWGGVTEMDDDIDFREERAERIDFDDHENEVDDGANNYVHPIGLGNHNVTNTVAVRHRLNPHVILHGEGYERFNEILRNSTDLQFVNNTSKVSHSGHGMMEPTYSNDITLTFELHESSNDIIELLRIMENKFNGRENLNDIQISISEEGRDHETVLMGSYFRNFNYSNRWDMMRFEIEFSYSAFTINQ